jgi:hypothetical protein
MRCVPPFELMSRWLTACTVPGTTRIRPLYDDVLDVLRTLVAIVPVDEAWYLTEYPRVAAAVAKRPDETATTHFRMHGYFEGRLPFAAGWRDLQQPIPFADLKTRLRIIVTRGRLLAEIEREDFLDLVRKMLRSVAVDEAWYLKTYSAAAEDIRLGRVSSAAEHYITTGYFHGALPADVYVDEEWYTARYDHVRNSLAHGSSTSPKDHFMRIGYGEGCQPTSP